MSNKNKSKNNIIIIVLIVIVILIISLFFINNKNSNNTVENTNNNKISDEVYEIPSANKSMEEIKSLINKGSYFENEIINEKDFKEYDFYKSKSLSKHVKEGFVLESNNDKSFEQVIILSSDTDPMTIYEELCIYYNTIFKSDKYNNNENSIKYIEDIRIGLKGKYAYVIICKEADQLSKDLTQLLRF